MLVIGFLVGLSVVRRLASTIISDPQQITNTALYALIAGVAGARIFHVIHYFHDYEGNLLSVFAVWKGGLELLGGFIGAITAVAIYLWYHKLPVRKCLDILAIGLMIGLCFGRIGCFLRGCCYGKPADLPWAVRFPYGSDVYLSQVYPDTARKRPSPQLRLPDDFFIYFERNNQVYTVLKSLDELTVEQKEQVKNGPYRCLPVHPTQLYSSVNAGLLGLILYLFWRRNQREDLSKSTRRLFAGNGSTFALVFILYGIARFFIEFVRDDNPFEYGWWTIYKGGTISQNLSVYIVIAGVVLMVIFNARKPQKSSSTSTKGKEIVYEGGN
ncbi:MAG: prolipoprotein diacylglyceryl transferase [Sedimentisphaerales bacterium]|nr:prolipoprotein diacylglyceryl transferase [Sedimentisphaerales bacterium]